MSKNIEVFVNEQGQPQHLAVIDERRTYELRKETRGVSKYRSVCGAPTNEQEVKSLPPNDVKIGCGDCAHQLKLWKEVNM